MLRFQNDDGTPLKATTPSSGCKKRALEGPCLPRRESCTHKCGARRTQQALAISTQSFPWGFNDIHIGKCSVKHLIQWSQYQNVICFLTNFPERCLFFLEDCTSRTRDDYKTVNLSGPNTLHWFTQQASDEHLLYIKQRMPRTERSMANSKVDTSLLDYL